MATAEEKIREIVVIPQIDLSASDPGNVVQVLAECANYVNSKTQECNQIVADTSAVSFMANSIQSRVVPTDLCNKLTKLYEVFNVTKQDEFELKMDELKASPPSDEAAAAVAEFEAALQSWEAFLREIDVEIEKVAGPATSRGLEGSISLSTSKPKTVNSGTLLAYVNSSPFGMLFIQMVTTFASPEASELVMKSYEKLSEFQELNCDILLLTRGSGGEGSGFLKLVGVPFRMLLDEQESLYRILQHRQSAISIAGVRALNLFTEIICNDEALDFTKSESDAAEVPRFGNLGGCILVDKSGCVLYSYTCTDNTNWPDVEVLLEQVKLNKKLIDGREPSVRNGRSPSIAKGETLTSGSTKITEKTSDMVAVTKKGCCTIL